MLPPEFICNAAEGEVWSGWVRDRWTWREFSMAISGGGVVW